MKKNELYVFGVAISSNILFVVLFRHIPDFVRVLLGGVAIVFSFLAVYFMFRDFFGKKDS